MPVKEPAEEEPPSEIPADALVPYSLFEELMEERKRFAYLDGNAAGICALVREINSKMEKGKAEGTLSRDAALFGLEIVQQAAKLIQGLEP